MRSRDETEKKLPCKIVFGWVGDVDPVSETVSMSGPHLLSLPADVRLHADGHLFKQPSVPRIVSLVVTVPCFFVRMSTPISSPKGTNFETLAPERHTDAEHQGRSSTARSVKTWSLCAWYTGTMLLT